MTSREQDNFIEALSLANDGASFEIRDGFADHHVNATHPRGGCWEIDEDATRVRKTLNHSVRHGGWPWGSDQSTP